MRGVVLSVVIVGALGAGWLGCQGDRVQEAPVDTDSGSDSGSLDSVSTEGGDDAPAGDAPDASDTSTDTGAPEAPADVPFDTGDAPGDAPGDALADGAFDGAFDAAPADCPTGSLVSNGTFTSGPLEWSFFDATPSFATGAPCGNAVRLVIGKYGNMHQSKGGSFKKGATYRLRVWTRTDAPLASPPPTVWAEFGHVDDAGVSKVEGLGVDIPTSVGWTLSQDKLTLTADATSLSIQVASVRTAGVVADDVWIAGFSIVAE